MYPTTTESGGQMPVNQGLLPGAIPSAPQPGTAQPVIVIMQTPANDTPTKEHYRKTFPKTMVMALSIFSIIAGSVSMITQIVLICMRDHRYGFVYISQGIWCGVWYIVTGAIGAAAAKSPSRCSVITLMVLSIISASMTIPNVVLDGIGLGIHANSYRRSYGDQTGLFAFMLFIGMMAGIASIVLSALTCRTSCCSTVKTPGTVIYNPATAQAIPMGNISQVINAQVPMFQQQASAVQNPPSYSSVDTQIQKQESAGNSYNVGVPPATNQQDPESPDNGKSDYKRFF